jgi:ATP-dependent exoDNAse (exonuclease V) beta subunit
MILDALAAITDAGRFVRYLRGPGGLDDYFGEHERAFGGTERIELEVLEQASREAQGNTVPEYAALLQSRSDALAAIRDDKHGIELTTIHRAKGCQWPDVHVFGCEVGQLPHARSLEVSPQERAAGEGIEAERRLAYVAFTRAQRELALHWTTGAPSGFLTEAGLRRRSRSSHHLRQRGRASDGVSAAAVGAAAVAAVLPPTSWPRRSVSASPTRCAPLRPARPRSTARPRSSMPDSSGPRRRRPGCRCSTCSARSNSLTSVTARHCASRPASITADVV